MDGLPGDKCRLEQLDMPTPRPNTDTLPLRGIMVPGSLGHLVNRALNAANSARLLHLSIPDHVEVRGLVSPII
jgi:hypothetical protein